ncbi:MAG: hypothetical protein WA924_03670 [Burkholderiaceae bacterium]
MKRTLQTLLLLLVMASLPLQSVAAAWRLACGPDHAQQAVMAGDRHGDDAQVAADHPHRHADHAPSAAGTIDASAADHAPVPDLHPHSTCSTCASCCPGTAAPPPVPGPAPIYAHPVFSTLPSSPLLAGFIPAGLERPPKRVSA